MKLSHKCNKKLAIELGTTKIDNANINERIE